MKTQKKTPVPFKNAVSEKIFASVSKGGLGETVRGNETTDLSKGGSKRMAISLKMSWTNLL